MQSSSPSSVPSHHPGAQFAHAGISHPGALSGPSGGFALDATHNDGRPRDTSRNRLERLVQGMERSLPLPTSPRGYLLFLCWLILIVGGMSILALMSAQILETRVQLSRLSTQHTLIQEQNAELVWLIARETNLRHVKRRLADKGYVPLTQVEYVVIGGGSTITAASPASLALGAELELPAATLSSALEVEPEPFVWSAAPANNGQHANNTLPASEIREPTGGWLAALGEGLNRWESIFWSTRLEPAPQPERSIGSGQTEPYTETSYTETDLWNWRSWLPLEAISSWTEAIPWLND
jgi:hypothetical protein